MTTSDELSPGEHVYMTADSQATFRKLVIYQMGDVNMDGAVNSRDVTMIKQYTVKMITLTAVQMVYADVYVDGIVNSRDAVLITQSVVRMPVKLGDRINVSFVYKNTTIIRTVHSGKTLTTIPTPTTGYRWSESKNSYKAPVYTKLSGEKTYYLVK